MSKTGNISCAFSKISEQTEHSCNDADQENYADDAPDSDTEEKILEQDDDVYYSAISDWHINHIYFADMNKAQYFDACCVIQQNDACAIIVPPPNARS